MALLVVALVVVVVTRIVGAVGSLFDGGPGATASSRPSTAVSPSPTPTLIAPAECAFGHEPASLAAYGDWDSTLLDTTFKLPKSYRPPNLRSVREAGFAEAGMLVRSLVVEDLAALRQAALDGGVPIDVVAAYRSFAQQASLFDRRKSELGLKATERKTARAGHSEHQLGTALDFKTKGEADVDRKWDTTPTGAWMQGNAWRFGFARSYPDGETDATCYASEPWHYRYFGRDLAAQIHASGLTVREFLWNRQHGGPPSIP